MQRIHQLLHQMYDLMLRLSAHNKAMFFLFLVSFAESSFFPIPPDVMINPMVLATPNKAWRIAGLATDASVLGGSFGYIIGAGFFDLIAKPIFEMYNALEQFKEF